MNKRHYNPLNEGYTGKNFDKIGDGYNGSQSQAPLKIKGIKSAVVKSTSQTHKKD